ncbi:MAG: TetR/AcrR family transcriptional regulator [Hydrogenophaga sp.]|uniref:TetR/AcrR family transcriptional regulator n=1 Tax=Hydrogenophaga sp. TaxID=1904254 RepID=UPI002616D5DF|nr:TetR/AcrR family transcriptional regulator [Hydrogenophaga sp.]MCV0437468.1 TetR/AcrR family transcriptional regulator [Hydrogenophaga sp.]
MKDPVMPVTRPSVQSVKPSDVVMPAFDGKPQAKKRGRREVKALETRKALFAAAAVVVGKYGYEEASITKITDQAGVANGTFYNYFETRQDLFDQLLPSIGGQLLEYIAGRLDQNLTGVDRERARIVTYFEFFQKNSGFLRILNEAEVYAPAAFRQHIQNFAVRYVKALDKQRRNGELNGFDEDELTAVAYMLMGVRTYLTMLWRSNPGAAKKGVDQSYISTYMKLVEQGLFVRK